MAADGVGTLRGAAAGKGYCCGAVVGVVPGLGGQVARRAVVGLHPEEVLHHRIVGLYGSSEGIEHDPAADDAHLFGAAALPDDVCLLGLDGPSQAVGKGVGVDIAVLGIMRGSNTLRVSIRTDSLFFHYPDFYTTII